MYLSTAPQYTIIPADLPAVSMVADIYVLCRTHVMVLTFDDDDVCPSVHGYDGCDDDVCPSVPAGGGQSVLGGVK